MTEKIVLIGGHVLEYEQVQINSAGHFVCTPSKSDVEAQVVNGFGDMVEKETADVFTQTAVAHASIGNHMKALGLQEY